MKNQAIQYLALDVHQATSVASVRDEGGSIRMRATLAIIGTPLRFRGKRQLWPYAGLAVVTRS